MLSPQNYVVLMMRWVTPAREALIVGPVCGCDKGFCTIPAIPKAPGILRKEGAVYAKIIKNDISKTRLITAAITAFIFIAAILTSLAAALAVNLFGAIDHMLLTAKTPHYMQMHTGDLGGPDMERLRNFAEGHQNVEAFQIREFLNIDGAEIAVGGNSLAWSMQDNGFSTQSKEFDFLTDLDGALAEPNAGEIYLPIYYMKQGAAKTGDTVAIRGVTFKIAGFLRDSQMNASLISSKRFLVSEVDLDRIRDSGIMEYLIEFRLKDPSLAPGFETEYLEAGLPANGPPGITLGIIRLANAISDGVMIAVLVLISALVIIAAFLCIRFTLLAKVEEDYREIGVLKAIGLRVSHIKRIYLAKYGALAGAACAAGFLVSRLIEEPFTENIRLYMGESGGGMYGPPLGAAGALAIFLLVVLYVNGVLRRFRQLSAAQAVRFGAPQEQPASSKRFVLNNNKLFSRNVFLGIKDLLSGKNLYVTMLLTLMISSFIVNVPQNIYNTISARSFMTYMGIGECDVILGVSQTQTDNVPGRIAEMAAALAQDPDVSEYTVLNCLMFDIKTADGATQRLRVELGDHSAFPITYSAGRAPQTESEIAISALNADDLGKKLGDEIVLYDGGAKKTMTVCGIYSDITNGGKTAKAVFETDRADILWGSIPLIFNNNADTTAKLSQYREMFAFAKISGIDEHMGQMFGSTIAAVGIASRVSVAAAVLLTMLVTLLFMKMLVTRDRYRIAVLKSIGFTSREIRAQYITRSVVVLLLGVAAGTALSNTLGELAGVALISSFGASKFDFVIDPLFAYLFSPLLIAACVYTATILGITDIRRLKVSEFIKEA